MTTRDVLVITITALVLMWWVASYHLAMSIRPLGSNATGWILPVLFLDLLVSALGSSVYALLVGRFRF